MKPQQFDSLVYDAIAVFCAKIVCLISKRLKSYDVG